MLPLTRPHAAHATLEVKGRWEVTIPVHPIESVRHLRAKLARRREETVVEAARTADPVERELIEGRFGDFKDDVYAASGDGIAAPGLPETTPRGLYEEFERDQATPHDPG